LDCPKTVVDQLDCPKTVVDLDYTLSNISLQHTVDTV